MTPHDFKRYCSAVGLRSFKNQDVINRLPARIGKVIERKVRNMDKEINENARTAFFKATTSLMTADEIENDLNIENQTYLLTQGGPEFEDGPPVAERYARARHVVLFAV